MSYQDNQDPDNRPRLSARHGSWLALLVTLAFGLYTQYQRLPHTTAPHGDAGTGAARNDGPANNVAGQFDYYLMSLSWSPTYCLTHADDTAQCSGKGFGFVLHGLWPQFDSGGYPEQCAGGESLTTAAESLGRTIYPSPKLVDHEWQEHGTCSGMDAAAYFRTADRALASVVIPPALEAPAADLQMSAAQIVTAFHSANPALPEDAVRVECSRGHLSEVRICLSRDLQPRACGRGVRTNCHEDSVTVRSSRGS